MLIIFFLIFFLLLTFFVGYPLILFCCGKIFKAQNITVKNSIITFIAIYIVGTSFQVVAFILQTENILIELCFLSMALFLSIWILKARFVISIIKSVAIYFTSLFFSFVFLLPSFLVINIYVAQTFKIESGGMHKAVQSGDRLLINKYIYKFLKPERGDIIAFKYPLDQSKIHVARIVAVAGDIIEIKDKELYINNELIDEPYVIHIDYKIISSSESPRDNYTPPVTIPENSFFVMGDNRDNSYDSRFWGVIEQNEIVGKAFFIIWSVDKENEKIRKDRIGKFL